VSVARVVRRTVAAAKGGVDQTSVVLPRGNWPKTPRDSQGQPYYRRMSRWDPEPTPYQRWFVHRRTKFRVGAILLMVSAIYMIVHDLLTVGLHMADVVPIGAIASSIGFLVGIREASRYVEKYDRS
jgi:hypothetical protein